MNFGTARDSLLGECDKQTSFEMLDFFYDNGGNFIDAASNYQQQETETWIGQWMTARENRDEMVVATKFTSAFAADSTHIKRNHCGVHSKSLSVSLEASLSKLQTNYIDLLYIHWWDVTASIPELMQSLHHMVASGKVLYLGISEAPARFVSKANEYARQQGLTQFSVYQGLWNVATRDFQRDILPMCEYYDMALAPWGTVGRGTFMSPEEFEKKNEGRTGTQPESVKKAVSALGEIAKKKGTQTSSVAVAYVMQKSPCVFPIVGGRTLAHLWSNIEGLLIGVSKEEVDFIENAAPFKTGSPLNFLFERKGKQKYKGKQKHKGKQKFNTRMTTNDILVQKGAGHLDMVQKARPPYPHKDCELVGGTHAGTTL